MCCWLHTPQRTGSGSEEVSRVDPASSSSSNIQKLIAFPLSVQGNNSMNVMTVSSEIRCEKPPEYDTVAVLSPPSYDDAIKLNPSVFLAASNAAAPSSSATTTTTVYLPEAVDSSKEESSSSTMVYPVSVNKSANSSSLRPPSPPVYTISTAMPNEVVTYDNERFTNDHRRSSTASRGGMEVMAASRR